MNENVPSLKDKPPTLIKQDQLHNLENASTYDKYLCKIAKAEQNLTARRSKIIATIGPTCCSIDMIEKLIIAGIDIARVNMALGDRKLQEEYLENVKIALKNVNNREPYERVVALAGDLRGPEIRTGVIEGGAEQVFLTKGSKVTLTTDRLFETLCTANTIFVDYDRFNRFVKVGQIVYLDNGFIKLRVTKIFGSNVECEVIFGGPISSKKVVALPGVKTDLPHLLEQDKRDIVFLAHCNVDYIFASFVRSPVAVREVRHILQKCEKQDIQIVAKIEDLQGVDNFDRILRVSDGIMIGRGDLGIEIPVEKVPVAQKMMVGKCTCVGSPIIVAAMVLESMKNVTRPSKAEVSDITMAVMDGADALMLAGETARGKFPVEAVQTLSKIIQQAEAAIWRKQTISDLVDTTKHPMTYAQCTAVSAAQTAARVGATAIIMTSKTGRSVRVVAKYRPNCPILCVVSAMEIGTKLKLIRGIIPVVYRKVHNDWIEDQDHRVRHALKVGQEMGMIKVSDPVVIISVWKQVIGIYNTIRVIYVPLDNHTLLY